MKAFVLLFVSSAAFACPKADTPAIKAVEVSQRNNSPTGAEILIDARGAIYVVDRKEHETLGCLTKSELDTLTDLLAKAPWKVDPQKRACDKSYEWSWIFTAGSKQYIGTGCGRPDLDPQTEKLFAFVDSLDKKYQAKP
ncbi:MAG: hypothetical protein QM831_26560 [Kofleriaceae bacterium]